MPTRKAPERKILADAIVTIREVTQARLARPVGDPDHRYERDFNLVRNVRDLAAKALDDANAAGDPHAVARALGAPVTAEEIDAEHERRRRDREDSLGPARWIAPTAVLMDETVDAPLPNAYAREPLRGDDKLIPATANLQHAVMRMRDSLPTIARQSFDATPQEFTVQVNLADLLAVLESFEEQPAEPAADEAVGAYTIDSEPLPNHRRIFSDGSGGTLSFDRGTTNIEVMDRLSKFGKLMDVVLDLLSVRTTGGHYRDFAEAAQVYENRVRLAGEQIAAVLPEPEGKPLAEGGPVFTPGGRKITVHTGRGSMRVARALRDIKTTLNEADTLGLVLPDEPQARLKYELALLDRVHHLSDRSTYGLEGEPIVVEHLTEPPAPAKRYRRVRPAGFEEERGTRVVNLGTGAVYRIVSAIGDGSRYSLANVDTGASGARATFPALCLDVVEEVSDAPSSPRVERGSGTAFC